MTNGHAAEWKTTLPQVDPGAESKFEYEQIMNQILSKMEMTDPEDLLPEDQYILGVDPEEIAKTTLDGRQAWMVNFETAIAAAGHAKRSRDELDNQNVMRMGKSKAAQIRFNLLKIDLAR